MTQIFISHSSADDSLIDKLFDWLKSEGYNKLFVDHRSIPAGVPWNSELPRQAKRSDIFILFVSKQWLESDECYAEYRSAYYGGKFVVPIIYGDPVPENDGECADRFRTLCASVQGVQVRSFPFDPVSGALLLGSIDAAIRKSVWEKRRRIIRRFAMSIAGTLAVLAGLGLAYRDNVTRELEKWVISSSFEPVKPARIEQLKDFATHKRQEDREFRECSTSDFCPQMVVVQGGRFLMGASDDFLANDWELPITEVHVPSFAVSKFEITLSQWSTCHVFTQLAQDEAKCKELPLSANTRQNPVASVSWTDAQTYVDWLNQMVSGSTDGPYRLLSEAEWEYASRGGAQGAEGIRTLYHWGDELSDACGYANALNSEMPETLDITRQGLDCPNNPVFATQVGTFEPNSLGLYDTAGNIAEWVEDCWHDDYSGRPDDARSWSTSSENQCDRVIRGGSWSGSTDHLRNAARSKLNPELFGFNIGFRVARDINH